MNQRCHGHIEDRRHAAAPRILRAPHQRREALLRLRVIDVRDDRGLHILRVFHGQRLRHQAAHRETRDAAGRELQLRQQRVDVVRVVGEAGGRRKGRLAVPAHVDGQNSEILRENRGERFEECRIHAHRMQQKHMRAAAGDAMIELYSHEQLQGGTRCRRACC